MTENQIQFLISLHPEVEFKFFKSNDSELVAFFHPQGFKDLGHKVVFGFCKYGNDFTNLIDELEVWAKSRQLQGLVGPLNFSTVLDYRLRTNHFDQIPFLGEPQNTESEYLMFQQNGFETLEKYESKQLTLSEQILTELNPIKQVIQNGNLSEKYLVDSIDLEKIERQLTEFYELTHAIFQENFCYQKIPFEIFKIYFQNELKPWICTKTSVVLKSLSGNACGYALNFKDRTNSENLLIKTVGVIPSERQMGLTFLMMLIEIFEKSISHYKSATLCLMKKGNFPDLISSQQIQKTYHYELLIKYLGS